MSKKKTSKRATEPETTGVLELAEVEGSNLEFAEDEVADDSAVEATGEDESPAEAATAPSADDPDAPHVLTLTDGDEGMSIDQALGDEAIAREASDDVATEDELNELTADAEGDADEGVAREAGADVEADDDAGEFSAAADDGELSGTELEDFESAEIEDVEVLAPEQIRSVVESALFATDKPLTIAGIKQVFKGTQVKSKDVREALTTLQAEYADVARGFSLEEIAGGFQLRTKPDNMRFLRQSVKARPFKLSGPALEVLSIVAYKQPTTKNQIDEIRGVESGHLLRALMEKHLLTFGERSDLPGKPMFYETTKKFLEIFSLRHIAELPSLAEIDQLIPEGIGDVEDKETLSDLTGQLSNTVGASYSEAEDELLKITDELTQITTSSEFFEDEKRRERERRDFERARDLREALTVGEAVEAKDVRWLERYDQALLDAQAANNEVAFVAGEDGPSEDAATEVAENEDVTNEDTSNEDVASTEDEATMNFASEESGESDGSDDIDERMASTDAAPDDDAAETDAPTSDDDVNGPDL